MLETALNVPLPIGEVARRAGLPADALSPHVRFKAKVDHTLGAVRSSKARYVLVTALTPTPAGEGKTVTTIGLSMALNRIGFPHVYAPRDPPDHPEFRFEWRNDLAHTRDGRNLRCVFVASRRELDADTLVPLLSADPA